MKNIIGKSFKPTVSLKSKVITKSSKILTTSYNKFNCTRTLKIDDAILTIIISEPNGNVANMATSAVLKNSKLVDEYLFGLDYTLDFDKVYSKTMDFLEFSDDTISKCGKVLFSYVKTVGKNKLTLYKILKRHGELLEYAVSNGEETFHVFKNGSWDYFSGKMKIAYDSQENIYSLSLTTRSETKLNELSLVKLFPRIKKRIYKIMDLF